MAMPAFGPKQTSQVAPHMSAFGGNADMDGRATSAGQGAYDPYVTCMSDKISQGCLIGISEISVMAGNRNVMSCAGLSRRVR